MALAHLCAMHALHLAPHSAAALQDDTVLHPFMEGSYLFAAAAAGTALFAVEPDARTQINHCWRALRPLQVGMFSCAWLHECAAGWCSRAG